MQLVKGFVSDVDRNPISGVLVSPYMVINQSGLRSSSTTGLLPVVTDAEGYFEMDLVDGVSGLDVVFSADGYCDRLGEDFMPRNKPREFELLEGVSVKGHIANNGQPIAGMSVAVSPMYELVRGEAFPQGTRLAVTDSEGRFELQNLAPGLNYCIYSVVGEANRQPSATIIKTQQFSAPASGETVDLGDLATTEAVSLGGRLVRNDEETVSGVYLRLNKDSARDLLKVAVSSDGTFRIDGLPPDVYEIELVSPDLELDPERLGSLQWSEKSIKRLLVKSESNLILPVRKVAGEIFARKADLKRTISGRVVFGEIGGLLGITVTAVYTELTADGSRREHQESATTDLDGAFTISGLPDGPVWLKLYRPSENGIVFRLVGMIQPDPKQEKLTLEIGPESTYQIEKIQLPIK